MDGIRDFTIILHAEAEGYWAEVLEVPGCASQGESLGETLANIAEALEGCLSVEL